MGGIKTKQGFRKESEPGRRKKDKLEKSQSQRKQLEETLQKSEYIKALILSSISELVIYQDRDQKIIWANKAAAESVEMTIEELAGRRCYIVWHERQSPCDNCPVLKALKTGKPHKAEITSPNGRIWLIRGYPVIGSNEDILGAVEVTLEITQRKHAEMALKESEEKYKTLVQTSPDAVMVTDIGGEITYVSEQALQLHGFDRAEELLGRRFFDLVAPESRAKAIIYLHKTLKEGITRSLEYTLLKKNGERFIGEINTSVAKNAGGNPNSFIATTRDVTDRKQVQRQLEDSIKEKELLLQEIHHRVKNNLQVISSILDLSGLRIDDTKAINLIDDARSKIQTMAFIHSQLYRSERFDRIDMGEHIRELINYLSAVYAAGEKITAHVDVTGIYLSLIQAIPCALVLNELISNAYKHAFTKGRKGTIEVSIARSGAHLIVMNVRDDGIGIHKELDIFKTNSLGLKLVRNLVKKQLKGKFRQKKERYTEFIVEFPVQEEEDKHV